MWKHFLLDPIYDSTLCFYHILWILNPPGVSEMAPNSVRNFPTPKALAALSLPSNNILSNISQTKSI